MSVMNIELICVCGGRGRVQLHGFAFFGLMHPFPTEVCVPLPEVVTPWTHALFLMSLSEYHVLYHGGLHEE